VAGDERRERGEPGPDAAVHIEIRDGGARPTPGASRPVPIVLVHGVLDSARSLGRLARLLEADRRLVVSYDRRGYQRSRTGGAPVGLAGHVDDLTGIIERTAALAGGRRPLVFGHSYGGIVALSTVGGRQDLVASVVVYEPPLSWLDWWGDGAARGTEPDLSPRPLEDPGRFAERFVHAMIGGERFARLAPDVRAGLRADGAAAAADVVGIARRAPFDPAALAVPLTVVRGELTDPRHVHGASWIAGAVPGATMEVVAGARHGGHLTHPGPLATIIGRAASTAGSAGGARPADGGGTVGSRNNHDR
jgi:pimeloyl-ACP methyl ester carboxylesterase